VDWSHGDAEAQRIGVAATRRRDGSESRRRGGAADQSRGDTKVRQIRATATQIGAASTQRCGLSEVVDQSYDGCGMAERRCSGS
jgi:hypothetical protein